MFGVIYLQGQDTEGDYVLVGYPAVRCSTHQGGHSPQNHGPLRVEILVGRLKGRQYTPVFLEPGSVPTASNQFVPLTDSPQAMYIQGNN